MISLLAKRLAILGHANLKRFVLVIGAAGTVGLIVLTVSTKLAMRELPASLTELTQGVNKPQLLDRDGRALTITFQNRWNVHDQKALHEIPSFLQRAFILAEDKRFYQHGGIDWWARLNAVTQNVLALKGVRGASTISEQVVRMVHVRPRSVWARWVEGWEARALEQRLDKASILEFYLNQVPYAAQRRGVQQAAHYYFDRELDTLSEKEMLALAVLVRAPSRFDLHKSTDRIQGRLHILIERAAESGLLPDATRVKHTPLLVQRPLPLINAAHFARHVYRIYDTRPSISGPQHKIRTSLDSQLQVLANKLLNDRLKNLANKNVHNAGMIVIDHHSKEVLAWAVGEDQDGTASEFDTVLNKRQPGSTLKPFVYAAALEKGSGDAVASRWTAATMIDDSPLQEGVGRGVHQYRNYSNTHYGPVSLRNALGNSLNIPAIKAAKYVGLTPLLNTLNQLGINELDLRSVDYGNGIALGNGEVSLYSMARAYTVLANRGDYQPLTLFKNTALAAPKAVFSAEVSSLIAHILSDPDARALEFGRGGSLNLPVQTAVKTGTSNDYRDAWVFGFNHRYVVGVWMGNLDSKPMQGITGSTGPAAVMRAMFAELNKLGQSKPLFLSPKLVQRSVCNDTGAFSNGRCASRHEYFLPNQRPGHSLELTQAKTDQPIIVGQVRQSQSVKTTPNYQLLAPIDQSLMAYDPRIPDELQQFEFKLNTHQGIRRVEWYLNDQLLASNQGASQLWQIQRGQYTLKAKVFAKVMSPPTVLVANYTVK